MFRFSRNWWGLTPTHTAYKVAFWFLRLRFFFFYNWSPSPTPWESRQTVTQAVTTADLRWSRFVLETAALFHGLVTGGAWPQNLGRTGSVQVKTFTSALVLVFIQSFSQPFSFCLLLAPRSEFSEKQSYLCMRLQYLKVIQKAQLQVL